MADLLNWNVNRALDLNGSLAPGAKAFFYIAGTNNPRTVYSDPGLTVPHPSPLVADAEGVFPPVYATGATKVLVTDADGVTLTGYPVDPCVRVPATWSAASAVSFNPTPELPETNVQAAIESAAASAAAGFIPFGLGVTGSTAVIANLDATNVASGTYRFDASSTGTFPDGVTAASLGVVEIIRETAAEAHMVLRTRGAAYTWRRVLTGSAWGEWQFDVLDEDDMASDSATAAPSQQSVKAYVLAQAALTEAKGFGVGQTWTDVTSSRAKSTSYRNTTGKPISVSIDVTANDGSYSFAVSTDNVNWLTIAGKSGNGNDAWVSGIVPDQCYYRLTGTTTITTWAELR